MPYFESEDYKVRREAAVTCCHMLALCMMKVSLLKENTTSGTTHNQNSITSGIGIGSCNGNYNTNTNPSCGNRSHNYTNVPQPMSRMSTINSATPSVPLPKRGVVSNITKNTSFITGRANFNATNNNNSNNNNNMNNNMTYHNNLDMKSYELNTNSSTSNIPVRKGSDVSSTTNYILQSPPPRNMSSSSINNINNTTINQSQMKTINKNRNSTTIVNTNFLDSEKAGYLSPKTSPFQNSSNTSFLVPKPLRSSREVSSTNLYRYIESETDFLLQQQQHHPYFLDMRKVNMSNNSNSSSSTNIQRLGSPAENFSGGTVFRRAGYCHNPLTRKNTPAISFDSTTGGDFNPNILEDSNNAYRHLVSNVDRLGGNSTPTLLFSSRRYINHKPLIYTRGPMAIAIDFILIKLLQLVVSDPSREVRSASLRCILETQIFDYYLSRKHHLDTLLFLLADELFDIKIDALTILGRIAFINPGLVLPPLRVLLLRLISEMMNASENKLKEEAILMICRYCLIYIYIYVIFLYLLVV